MARHLKYSIPDFVFCLLASAGIGMNVAQSFLLPAGLSADVPRTFLVSAVTIAVMILFSYSRRSAAIGGIAGAAAAVALLALAALGFIPGLAETADAEANAGLWYLIVVFCAAAVYLLCRSRAGSWLLLGCGVVLSGYFLLLEYICYPWALVLFVGAMGVWICYLTYRKKLLAASARRTAFLPALYSAGILAAVCLAAACLLWLAVIRPLSPPTAEPVLTTQVLETEALKTVGVYNSDADYDPDLADGDEEQNYDTSEQEEDRDSDAEEHISGEQSDEHSESGEDADETLDADQEDGTARHITYSRGLFEIIMEAVRHYCWLVVIVIALLALFFMRRKIWYRRKMASLDDTAYILAFFPWYLKRFKRLKLPAPGGSTPKEYAKKLKTAGRFLDRGPGGTWEELSVIFAEVSYGGRGARPGEREKFEGFYRRFYRRCRRKLKLAWLWKSLRL